MAFLASFILKPLNCVGETRDFSVSNFSRPVSRPVLSIIILVSSECFCHQYTSVSSPNVQHITKPVPLSMATLSSGRILTLFSPTGTIACLPSRCL
ncbi:hypothetical protein ANAPC5_00940 [Anaplasma phagocytophilum]|nr:hypothetical protein ANAPC3_00911 [Anaplasma phagocytophilum]SCV64698.1 hypothetical protein ANAPC5_00940 [Anaplasma phagocytophilum]